MKIGLLIKLIFSGFSLHWIPKQDWDFVFFFFFFFLVLLNFHIPNMGLVFELLRLKCKTHPLCFTKIHFSSLTLLSFISSIYFSILFN